MPRGIYERKKENIVAEDLTKHEQLTWEVAGLIQDTLCSIPGCVPKHHIDDANRLVRKLINLGLLDSEK